jgi:hypothetical protein
VSSIGAGSHALLKFFDRLCLPHRFGPVLVFAAIEISFKVLLPLLILSPLTSRSDPDLLREHTVWSSFFLFCCRSWVSPCAARGPTGSSDFSVRGPLLRFRLILGRACSRCGSHRPRFSVLLCVQHTAPGERSVQQWSRYRSLLLIWFPRQDFVLPPGSQLLGFGFWFARPGRSRLF